MSSATCAEPPRDRRVGGITKWTARISEHQSGRSAAKKVLHYRRGCPEVQRSPVPEGGALPANLRPSRSTKRIARIGGVGRGRIRISK